MDLRTKARQLASFPARRPKWILAIVLILAVPCAWFARGLELRADFGELLPEREPSVIAARELDRRLPSSGVLAVVAWSQEGAARRRFVEEFSRALEADPKAKELIARLDRGPGELQTFAQKFAWFYLDLADLETLKDALLERTSPFFVQLDSGAAVRLRAIADKAAAKQRSFQEPDRGLYTGENGQLQVLLVRSTFPASQIGRDEALVAMATRALESVSRLVPGVSFGLAGGVMAAVEEHRSLKNDLTVASAGSLGLILVVVWLYFRSLPAMLALGVVLAAGLGATFAITEIAIGYLNSTTAFLTGIIAGNGVNYGILLLARYQEHKHEGHPSELAMHRAILTTWRSTMTASVASGGGYAALAATSFRGFSHFGFLGGIGMILCWIATFVVLPPFVLWAEGLGLRFDRSRVESRRFPFGSWLARVLVRTGHFGQMVPLVLGMLGLAFAVAVLRNEPFEQDFRKYGSRARARGDGTAALTRRIDAAMGNEWQAQAAVLAKDVEAAYEVSRRMRKAEGLGKVRAVGDLLPAEAEAKAPLIREITHLLTRARALADAGEMEILERLPPLSGERAPGLSDLPDAARWAFSERDGTVGRVVFVRPPEGSSSWDGRALRKFAAALRRVPLPEGSVVSGRALIFADLVSAMVADAPAVSVISVLLVLMTVVFAFGWRWPTPYVLLALSVGVSMAAGLFVLLGERLNFLNFVALPLTLGIGVDYAVNVAARMQVESFVNALRSVSGALALCALTTIIGYAALMWTDNQAIASFGRAAICGELACLFVALTALPLWLRRRAT